MSKVIKLNTSTQGQLTGIPRQIKDSVADLYNLLSKWDKLNSQGFSELTHLCDIKIALFKPKDMEKNDVNAFYSEELESACYKLTETYSKLKKISENLIKINDKFSKLDELGSFDSFEESNIENIPFQTWPISNFHGEAFAICEMYSKEIEVKRIICENAAHVEHDIGCSDKEEKCRNMLMSYSSCWLHQPYVNENTRTLVVEGMLYETGHNS